MGISVIIPTLNEESHLSRAIKQLRLQQPHEIIVVDGGSNDLTCAAADGADLLLHSPPGRAVQMNLGAARATGDVLLFIHADCALEPGALEEALSLLDHRGVAAGCFTMRVHCRGCSYRAIDACATARVRLTGLIYGDQGLFLKREVFARLGGFPTVCFMEDVLFSRMLRPSGRMVVASRHILVSARRWQRTGLVHQTLRNWTLTALVAAGVYPDRLASFYPAVR